MHVTRSLGDSSFGMRECEPHSISPNLLMAFYPQPWPLIRTYLGTPVMLESQSSEAQADQPSCHRASGQREARKPTHRHKFKFKSKRAQMNRPQRSKYTSPGWGEGGNPTGKGNGNFQKGKCEFPEREILTSGKGNGNFWKGEWELLEREMCISRKGNVNIWKEKWELPEKEM